MELNFIVLELDFNMILVIVIGVVILVALALWLGRGIIIQRDKDGGLTVKTDPAPQILSQTEQVVIGKGAELDKVETGIITGLETEPDSKSNKEVDILSGSKVKDSTFKNITGVKIQKPPKEQK